MNKTTWRRCGKIDTFSLEIKDKAPGDMLGAFFIGDLLSVLYLFLSKGGVLEEKEYLSTVKEEAKQITIRDPSVPLF